MTTKRIVFTRPDGGVSLCAPVARARAVHVKEGLGVFNGSGKLVYSVFINGVPRLDGRGIRVETDDEFVDRVRANPSSVPQDSTNVFITEEADLPYVGRLQDAWTQAGAELPTVDMDKAHTIKMGLIRVDRDKRLAALDGPELGALAQDDQVELDRIRGVKQMLRDLPSTVQPALDAIPSPRVLDDFEPAWPV